MSKAKKEEQKMGTDELQMHILMEKIDGMVENLPKYLKQNIVFQALLKARDDLSFEIQRKLDKLSQEGNEYVETDFYIDEIMEPITVRACDIIYDRLVEEYPFSLLLKEAKDRGCTVYNCLDEVYHELPKQ